MIVLHPPAQVALVAFRMKGGGRDSLCHCQQAWAMPRPRAGGRDSKALQRPQPVEGLVTDTWVGRVTPRRGPSQDGRLGPESEPPPSRGPTLASLAHREDRRQQERECPLSSSTEATRTATTAREAQQHPACPVLEARSAGPGVCRSSSCGGEASSTADRDLRSPVSSYNRTYHGTPRHDQNASQRPRTRTPGVGVSTHPVRAWDAGHSARHCGRPARTCLHTLSGSLRAGEEAWGATRP